jgi:phosphatidate cytidylyltransferase
MSDLRRRTGTGLWFGAAAVAVSLAPWQVFGAALLVTGVLATRELIAFGRPRIETVGLGALLYSGLIALFWLRTDGIGPVFLALIPTWMADVVAYLVGSRFGRRKLALRISPGKTWEGTIAGFVAAGIVAAAIGSLGEMRDVWAFAILVGPVALAGDLLESAAKRRAGVKDSGRLFPGHGGMLDRIDSLIAVALLVVAFYA